MARKRRTSSAKQRNSDLLESLGHKANDSDASETKAELNDAVRYASETAGTTAGSTIGRIFGSSIAKYAARHWKAFKASAIIGSGAAGAVLAFRIISKVYGTTIAGIVVSQIGIAALTTLLAILRKGRK